MLCFIGVEKASRKSDSLNLYFKVFLNRTLLTRKAIETYCEPWSNKVRCENVIFEI